MLPMITIPLPASSDLSGHAATGLPLAGRDALLALHTRTLDSLAGFETMVQKAEPAFLMVAESFRALHARHAASLAGYLAANGHAAEATGSLMGTINQTVVSVRSWFDEIDADLMSSIRNGEAHVLRAFDAVLAQSLPATVVADVSGMRDELVSLLDRSPAAA